LWGKRIDDNTITTAHETFGPTSIEFQSYFSDLLNEYLGKSERKLVIVLDNLDRVPTETARTLWTTLRVFAECCEKECNSEWSERVWFLVPYDPSATERIWKQNESTAYSDSEDEGSVPVPSRLAAAFLDKTFHVRFDVPPLMIADWKNFLRSQLEEAFGTNRLSPDVVHRVYLLSRRMALAKERPPTPRHLKLYVNDIGALYRRFVRIPVDHLALYAIIRRSGNDIRHWLLKRKSAEDVYQAIFDDDTYLDSLSAIAFGISDPADPKAKDLLLRTPISSALTLGNVKSLQELKEVHGFWEVLELMCDEPDNSFDYAPQTVLNTL